MRLPQRHEWQTAVAIRHQKHLCLQHRHDHEFTTDPKDTSTSGRRKELGALAHVARKGATRLAHNRGVAAGLVPLSRLDLAGT